MALKFPISVIVSALDKISGPLKGVESRLSQFGLRTAKIGKALTLGVTTPLLGAGAAAIWQGLKFEKALNRIRTFGGASAFQMDILRKTIKQMGMEGPFSAVEIAEAMELMADETANFGRVAQSITPTLQLAKVLDVLPVQAAETIEKISDLEPSFQRIADIIADVGVTQPGSVTDFVAGLQSIVPTAKVAGVSLEGAAEMMATLTGLAEFTPSKAASGVNLFLANLKKSDAQEALRDLPGWLAKLRAEGVQGAVVYERFGNRAGAVIETLLKMDPGKIEELRNAIGGGGGAAKWMAELGAGPAGEWAKLKSAISGILIEAADSGLLATFVEILKDLRDVLKWFANLSPGAKKGLLYGLAGAAGLGPGLSAVGGAAGWIGLLGKFVPGAAKGVAAGAGALNSLLGGAGAGLGLAGAAGIGATLALSGDSPAAAQSSGKQSLIEGFGAYFRAIFGKGEQKPVEISVINAPPGTRVMSNYDENGHENYILDFGGTMKD